MLYHNRSFFRKLIKLRLKNTKSIFLNKNTTFKDSRSQKLTPHKFKKTNIFNPTNIYFFNLPMTTRLLKVSKIGLSSRAIPYSATKINSLGAKFLTHTILGNSINLLWNCAKIYSHNVNFIAGMGFQLNSLNILSNVKIADSMKQIALLSSVTAHINSEGLLVIKLRDKETKFISTTFTLGLPSKERTNHMAITSRVRSIAKNPIDHPNGGRASTKGSFKTPWGAIAKHNK